MGRADRADHPLELLRRAVVLAIADLLHMVHVEGLEMPYVAQHLKDRVAPLLRGRRDDSRPPPRDASGAVIMRRRQDLQSKASLTPTRGRSRAPRKRVQCKGALCPGARPEKI